MTAASSLRVGTTLGYGIRMRPASYTTARRNVAQPRSLSYTRASQQQPCASITPIKPTLTLYTGTDCQLCDVAKDVLEDVAREVPFTLHLYNIRDDSMPDIARWRRAYQYDIPVLHLNGREIARHRLQRGTVLEQIREASK